MTLESPLMTAKEAAAYLRCGRTFVTEHRAELGGIKRGGTLMFTLAGLTAYLDRCQIAQVPVRALPARPALTRRPTVDLGPINPVTRQPWRAETLR